MPTDRNCFKTLIAVVGEWEALIPYTDDASKMAAYTADPVIAWGLTRRGEVVPVTASDLDGVRGPFGLRRHREPRVYSAAVLGGYDNADQWLVAEHLPPQLR